MNRTLSFLLLLLILLLHLPFLTADPRLTFCASRGPFTDEGFYLMQLRSHLAGNGWNLYSADNLLKSPLFSLLHYAPLKLFGSNLALARGWTLLLAFIPVHILCFDKKWSGFLLFFAVIVLMQEYVFDYYHYALSESLFCSVTLLGIWLLWKYSETGNHKSLLVSLVLFGLVLWLKVQFVYVLALPVALLIFISVKHLLSGRFRSAASGWAYFLVLIFLFLAAYWLLWYHPNKDFYSYILKAVNKDNFIPMKDWRESFEFYYDHLFLIPENKTYTRIFIGGFIAALIGTLTGAFSKLHRFLFLAFATWFVIELHKLTFYYVPLRYIIPLFVSGFALVALSISGWLHFLQGKMDRVRAKEALKVFSLAVILFLLTLQMIQYQERFKNRTYVLRQANEYMKWSVNDSGWIAGNWAASLSWTLPNPSLPVWNGLLNDDKVFREIFPEVIVSEQDEHDSGGAYKNRGIILHECSDSSRVFCIGRWEVAVFWMNESKVRALIR